MNFVIDM